MKNRCHNLLLVLRKPMTAILWIVISAGVWIIMEYYTDRALIVWNYGKAYANFVWFIDVFNTILLWGFIASSIWKWTAFAKPQKTDHKGRRGWVFSILVSGCPTCTITLASYLWLASIITLLPYNWLELKILWTLLLCRSLYKNIKTLTVCELPAKKK